MPDLPTKNNKLGIAKVMELEMTRHEFLRYMVAVAFGLFGVTKFFSAIHDVNRKHTNREVAGGYGSGPYGR